MYAIRQATQPPVIKRSWRIVFIRAMSLRRGHCDLSPEAGNADVLRKSHHEYVFDLDPSSTDQWAPLDPQV